MTTRSSELPTNMAGSNLEFISNRLFGDGATFSFLLIGLSFDRVCAADWPRPTGWESPYALAMTAST